MSSLGSASKHQNFHQQFENEGLSAVIRTKLSSLSHYDNVGNKVHHVTADKIFAKLIMNTAFEE